MIHRFHGAVRRPEVVRDLARVHLVREPHALGVEHVEYRVPALREVRVAALDHGRGHRGEHGDRVPDRRAGEADHGRHAEGGRGPCRVRNLGGSPLTHPLGLSVAPDARGQDALVPFVDRVVADRLADEVRRDRPALQAVLFQQRVPSGQVAVLTQRPVDLEVVSPAGDL